MAIPNEVAAKLKTSINRFASEAARTAQNAGPDEVHDVRVSIRRLQQALEIFGGWLPAGQARRVGKRLKTTLTMAGDVRDRDIALDLIAQLELAVGGDVRGDLEAGRYAAAGQLAAALGELMARQVPAKWTLRLGLDATREEQVLPQLACVLLPRLASEFIDSGTELARQPKSRRRLHAFRVSSKRFRYSMEFLSDLYGPAIGRRVTTVRKVQTALGDLQDCVATRRMLRGFGVSRALLQPLRHEENKRLGRFEELWPTLFPSGAADEWARGLGQLHRRRARARAV